MAQLALQAGNSAEAKLIVDKGFAAGALGTGAEADRHKRLKALVEKKEAEDKAAFAGRLAEATAAKDGNALVQLGASIVAALGGGVFCIDTGFQRPLFDAAYLIVHEGHAAFIDTGTAFAVPRLLEALAATGLQPNAVDWIIPTHVHLDHAGGVGALLSHLPSAKVLVHPRGARHMADPAALWQGATAVYGEDEMQRSYGALTPVPLSRLQESHDDMRVVLGGRELRLADTPGHARHHHCIWDEHTRGWFTGDTFGVSYRELDVNGQPWVLPSSTPVQFDPPRLRDSIHRLLAAQPEQMYLTHYGALRDVPRLAVMQLELLSHMEVLGEEHAAQADPLALLQQGLIQIYLRSLRQHGSTLSQDDIAELLSVDVTLNAQGMAVWLQTRHKASA
ncbi:MAG: MBL fold metallo-hydrolase [Ideonella sp. MAG2]|nr:MAG: MBL fold metallo-hydrolase [Ideonella sp. MAG2]